MQADDRAIQAEYTAAQRTLTPQLANAYAEVLETEYQDGYFEAHLRTAALSRIPAVTQSGWRRLCPDFVFFEEVRGTVLPSIVDPHGHHLGDALPKLRGLATYAATYGDQFHRVEALSEIEGELRVLDLTEPGVREAVMAAEDVVTLYLSDAASRY